MTDQLITQTGAINTAFSMKYSASRIKVILLCFLFCLGTIVSFAHTPLDNDPSGVKILHVNHSGKTHGVTDSDAGDLCYTGAKQEIGCLNTTQNPSGTILPTNQLQTIQNCNH